MIIKNFDLNDVFVMSEIIDKMGLDADVEKITKQIKTAKLENKQDAAALGKEVAVGLGLGLTTKIIRNFYKARKEVIQLISNMTGKNHDEVAKMGLKELKAFFTELAKDQDFKDFLVQRGE